MKIFLIIPFIAVCLPAIAQRMITQPGVAGHYRDYFGSEILLKPDSGFQYLWSFDLEASWVKGTYSVRHDTIYLKMIPVFDTVQVNHGIQRVDSLVLSDDGRSRRIHLSDQAALSSGGQNVQPYPRSLYYRKSRLYEIDKQGKLIRKKRRGWSKKKFVPWYFRTTQGLIKP